MATNTQIAHQVINAYALASARDHIVFLSYNEIAKRIGRQGEHHLLGDLWGKIQELCERDGVPDVAACIVNLYSLNTGQLKPAEKVVERHGGWEGVRREQAAVMTFDWEDWLRENTWS